MSSMRTLLIMYALWLTGCIGSTSWCSRVAVKVRNARDSQQLHYQQWKYDAYCGDGGEGR